MQMDWMIHPVHIVPQSYFFDFLLSASKRAKVSVAGSLGVFE
jgi:hypothetical protein